MPVANTLGWSDEQIDEFKQAFYSFDEDGEVGVSAALTTRSCASRVLCGDTK